MKKKIAVLTTLIIGSRILGKTRYQQTLTTGTIAQKVAINNVEAGIYFLVVTNNSEQVQIKKFVIH